MLITRRLLPALTLFSLLSSPALSSSSAWYETEGGAIRIVTSGLPDADGKLRGALEIRLEPGWKTYWLDPGTSGVPPVLSALADGRDAHVEIGFPPPQRINDGYARWAGYGGSVSLALTFSLPPEASSTLVEASTFLGICETICVPVQASLVLDPAMLADDWQHEGVVASAFAALPPQADDDMFATVSKVAADAIIVEARVPEGVEVVDLFVAGTDTLSLDAPRRLDEETVPTFSVPASGPLAAAPAGKGLVYTLVTSSGSVTGQLSLP